MKSAFLASILICVIAGTLVVSKQKGNAVRPLLLPCEDRWMEYAEKMMNVKGYHIATGKSLDALQTEVVRGLDSNESWRPFGGVTYDPNKKQYLQVMVNTHQPPTYP
ncbi:MAG TPA: hypothetical protein DIU00_08690 [Phycisphaerales bacterium]|nr:hypothetical protein [Phycisphaerales bacterium]